MWRQLFLMPAEGYLAVIITDRNLKIFNRKIPGLEAGETDPGNQQVHGRSSVQVYHSGPTVQAVIAAARQGATPLLGSLG